jgi:uncharacterized protein DUF6893
MEALEIIVAIILIAIVALVVMSLPDIKRYVRISRM